MKDEQIINMLDKIGTQMSDLVNSEGVDKETQSMMSLALACGAVAVNPEPIDTTLEKLSSLRETIAQIRQMYNHGSNIQ